MVAVIVYWTPNVYWGARPSVLSTPQTKMEGAVSPSASPPISTSTATPTIIGGAISSSASPPISTVTPPIMEDATATRGHLQHFTRILLLTCVVLAGYLGRSFLVRILPCSAHLFELFPARKHRGQTPETTTVHPGQLPLSAFMQRYYVER